MSAIEDVSSVRTSFRNRSICVIIPTYNNVGTIGCVVTEAQRYCDDVIVVDDGSDDGTTEVLRAIEGIELVHYDHNRGKGHALKVGFMTALHKGFAYAITMDADGQHKASDLPAFLEANKQWRAVSSLDSVATAVSGRTKANSLCQSLFQLLVLCADVSLYPRHADGLQALPIEEALWLPIDNQSVRSRARTHRLCQLAWCEALQYSCIGVLSARQRAGEPFQARFGFCAHQCA